MYVYVINLIVLGLPWEVSGCFAGQAILRYFNKPEG